MKEYNNQTNDGNISIVSKNMEIEKETKKPGFGFRHWETFMAFLAVSFINVHRQGLAIAIVKMVNSTQVNDRLQQRNISSMSCPILSNKSDANQKNEGEFDWSPTLQGYILGAGFLGYALGTLTAGRFAEIYGYKGIILVGHITSSIAVLVSPFLSRWNIFAMIVAQLIRGVGEGVLLPASLVMVANWAPKCERGLHTSFIISGYYVGAFFGGTITGFICDSPQLGWPYAFYLRGSAGILISVALQVFLYDSPKDHPKISVLELEYIIENQECHGNQKRPDVPWSKVLTSIPIYAAFYGFCGQLWLIFYFLSVHPTYLATILHIPIKENGLFSSSLYLVTAIAAWTANWLSDWLYGKEYVEVGKLRKGFNFVGSFFFCACLLGVYFSGCDYVLNIICFILAMYSIGIITPGVNLVTLDMSPRFSGTIFGIMYGLASSVGFILPPVVGVLTEEQTIEGWHNAFLLSICIVLSSAIVFALWGSSELQPWNFVEADEEKVKAHHKTETNKNDSQNETQITRF